VTTKLFGEPVRRREDARLITGKGRYLDDIGSSATLAAAFVRSPHAHARITDIDVEGCLDVEGLVAIYTYEDLTGPMAEPLPVLIPHPQLHAPRTGFPLANGIVHHVGEPIAMVIATDRYIAEDAAERILVTYEELPVVVGVDAAREATATVHDDVPDNVAARHHQETGDVDAALSASAHTLAFTQYIERSACMPMEGKGVHAKWDADDASLRVYTSTQASTSVRAAIAAKLELSLDKVEVIAPDVGGGFGVKIVHPWPEELLSSGPRTAASTSSPRRTSGSSGRRSGSGTTTRAASPRSTSTSGTTTARTRPTGSSCRS
jgi:aerobic carbon-monoxide dehydrogenase large subunit